MPFTVSGTERKLDTEATNAGDDECEKNRMANEGM